MFYRGNAIGRHSCQQDCRSIWTCAFWFPCEPHTEKDSCYGWIVAAAAFVSIMITDGVTFGASIFVEPMKLEFGGPVYVSIIFLGLIHSIPLCLSPAMSPLVHRIGLGFGTALGGGISGVGLCLCYFANEYWVVCLVLAVFVGIGFSLIYLCTSLVVSIYFEKKRALATGITFSGSGVGVVIFPPLLEYLVDCYAWRGSMLILGGIVLNISAFSIWLRPFETTPSTAAIGDVRYASVVSDATTSAVAPSYSSEPTNDTTPSMVTFRRSMYCQDRRNVVCRSDTAPNNDKCCTIAAICAHPLLGGSFLLVLSSNCILYLGYDVFYTLLPILAIDLKISHSSWLLSLIGGSTVVGQIALGFLSDMPRVNVFAVYIACMLVSGLCSILVPLMDRFYEFALLSSVWGFFVSSNYSMTPIMVLEFIGMEYMNISYSVILCGLGVSSLIGIPLTGAFKDVLNSFDWSYRSAGICMIISGLILVPVAIRSRCLTTPITADLARRNYNDAATPQVTMSVSSASSRLTSLSFDSTT